MVLRTVPSLLICAEKDWVWPKGTMISSGSGVAVGCGVGVTVGSGVAVGAAVGSAAGSAVGSAVGVASVSEISSVGAGVDAVTGAAGCLRAVSQLPAK